MPAAIASPTARPLRSVERTSSSDIGPTWSATKKPRPNPTATAPTSAIVQRSHRLSHPFCDEDMTSRAGHPVAPAGDQKGAPQSMVCGLHLWVRWATIEQLFE